MSDRSAFEAAISGPPYEYDTARWPDDQAGYAWPGSYRIFIVELAWQMWQEAIRQEREDAQRLNNAGSELSNIAFNWSQTPGYVLTKRDCEMLDKLRKTWDTSIRSRGAK